MVDDIAIIGLGVDSAPVLEGIRNLDKFDAAAIRTERNAEKLGNTANRAFRQFNSRDILAARRNLEQYMTAQSRVASSSGNMTHALTNASFQVQDFAVQVASGQSALMAFAQQFPQLTGALGFSGKAGLYGALIGTAAAIGVSLYGAMAKAEEKAATLEDAMGDLDESFSSFSNYLKIAATDTADLTEKFGFFANEVRGFSEYMRQVSLAEVFDAQKEAIDKAVVGLDAVKTAYDRLVETQLQYNEMQRQGYDETRLKVVQDVIDGLREDLLTAADAVGLTSDQAMRLRDAMLEVKNARTMEEMASKAYDALAVIKQIVPAGYDIPAPMREAVRALEEMARKAAEANQEIGKMPSLLNMAVSAANSVATAVDGIATSASTAAGNVATLATNLWNAAMAKAAAAVSVENDTGGLAAQYALYGQGRAAGNRLATESGSLFGGKSVLPPGKGKKGGGGGGGSDPYADNLKRLVESLMTERETVDAWYNENLKILEDRRAAEILGEQGHKEALISIEEEYQQRIAEIQQTARENTLGHYSTLFDNMASIAQAGGDKTTGVVKAFSIAQGLINSYLAYTQVLADPSLVGRPFLRTALAASTLAAGLAQVANMKSGGSGGSSRSTNSGTATAKAEPERVTRVELQGEEWLVSLADNLMTQIYDASKNGRVIVSRA